MYGNINNCWLNVNRACNLSCKWCYARSAHNSEITVGEIKKILIFLEEIKVSHVTILGGEPTCFSSLDNVISLASEKGITTTLVTNGIHLANSDYLKRLVSCGLGNIGVSLKGYDEQSFKQTTLIDGYKLVLRAIRNITEENIPFSVSYVMDESNIGFLKNGIRDAKNNGAYKFSLSFCYHFEASICNKCICENPYKLANLFERHYDELDEASEGKMSLFQTLPLCVWKEDFIATMVSKNQIRSICQALQKSGLIFDTDLNIIPCNAMHDYKLGQFGVDFTDKDSFEKFWNSSEIMSFYDRIRAVPDETCLKCHLYQNCGGGCISNWFNYSFADLKKMEPIHR